MTRGLVAFAFVACVLSGLVVACGAPVADVTNPNSPQAQATDVRRTEVAAAQRVIANNPTATSTAAPTAPALPTCQAKGAIWWYEARTHIGELRTIQGTILATRPAPGGLALLEIGQRYPDPTGLAVLIPATSGSSEIQPLVGKSVCFAGRVASVQGRPTMQLRDASSILVMK